MGEAVAGDLELEALLRCPRCRAPVEDRGASLFCIDATCDYARRGFPRLGATPVMIDFDASILVAEDTVSTGGASPAKERPRGKPLTKRIISTLLKSRGPTEENARRFLDEMGRLDPRPRVLIVGGGARGVGTEPLYAGSARLVGTDIYLSDDVAVLADGHQLPFADGAFHGVWIQAVLEHVLDPARVVAEIHRVLAPEGVVYAETPFMQQVHEGAYDFTRFTLSGHRWLFRNFAERAAGVTRGMPTSLLWSIRYFVASVTGSYRWGTLGSLPFFWIKYFEPRPGSAFAVDGASGVFFMGVRSDVSLGPKDMITYYSGAQRSKPSGDAEFK